MTLGTWLSHAGNVWRTQAQMHLDDGSLLFMLKPKMYLVHWGMELYLKSLQMGLGLAPPETHSLVTLYEAAVREAPALYADEWIEAVKRIDPFGNDEFGGVRYPSPKSYSLRTDDVEHLESLIALIESRVDPAKDVRALAPRLHKILARRETELAEARRRVQEGRAGLPDEKHLYAYLEISEQVEYWVDQAAEIGWQPGAISSVEVLTRMVAEVGITKFAELTRLLKAARAWGRPFLERVFENQRREWMQVAGADLGHPPMLDRQGILIYLLVGAYNDVLNEDALRERFGWGSTTAVTDAAASAVLESWRVRSRASVGQS